MIKYEDDVLKISKRQIAKRSIFIISSCVHCTGKTNDLKLFDIKRLQSNEKRTYYRLRKNKYRAIFYIEDDDYFIISIAKREEVYKNGNNICET